jgi:hypothetical protein
MEIYSITSEDSSIHWLPLNPQGKAVLDLGCGRHGTSKLEETSPVYLGEKEATKVVAVDGNGGEIEYYLQNKLDPEKYTFLHKNIEAPKDVLDLFEEHNIQVLKCDIEGYEVVLYHLDADDMKNITDLGIEYHTLDILERMKAKIEEWGFKIDVEAKFTYCEAPTMGVLFCTRK